MQQRRFGPPVKARPPVLTHDMSGHAVAQAAVCAALDKVLGNASEVGAGSGDEEHVHQLRIGLRRLRTALRELGPLAEGADPACTAADARAALMEIRQAHPFWKT